MDMGVSSHGVAEPEDDLGKCFLFLVLFCFGGLCPAVLRDYSCLHSGVPGDAWDIE